MLNTIYAREHPDLQESYAVWWPIRETATSYIVISGQDLKTDGPLLGGLTVKSVLNLLSVQPHKMGLYQGDSSLEQAVRLMENSKNISPPWRPVGDGLNCLDTISIQIDGTFRKLPEIPTEILFNSQNCKFRIQPEHLIGQIYGEPSVLWS